MRGRSRMLAGVAAAAAATGCSDASRTSDRAVRVGPAPAAITKACARAATSVTFTVLCPARWPSPRGRGGRMARLFEKASGVYLLDAANGFTR